MGKMGRSVEITVKELPCISMLPMVASRNFALVIAHFIRIQNTIT